MHKRSVIINDWGNELGRDDSFLPQYIALLLDEGFPVYQVQGDTLVPIHNIRVLNAIPSDVLEERNLYKLLNDHKLEKDKVYILCHDKIAALCGELFLSSVKDYPINPKYSDENNNRRRQFNAGNLTVKRKHCNQPTSPDSICRLQINRFWDDKILTYFNPDNLTVLELERVPQEAMKALVIGTPRVNTLIVTDYQNSASFDILSLLPQLEKLRLEGNYLGKVNVIFPNVKWLTLMNQSIEAIDFETMLQYMPNLETLQLEGVKIIGEFQNFNSPSLKMLEISDRPYSSIQMSGTVLSTLINQSPTLISLKINCKYFDTKSVSFTPRKSLRLLSLANMTINAKSLESLLSESLVHLELESIKLEGEMNLAHPLNHLVRLKVLSSMSQNFWTNCSEMAPAIQDLNVSGCDNSTLKFTLFKHLQFFRPEGYFILFKEEAIKLLQWTHTFKIDADIKIELKLGTIRYCQTYSSEGEPANALIVNCLNQDVVLPILQTCAWIKTIKVGNPTKDYLALPDNSHHMKLIVGTSTDINTDDFEDWKSMEIEWRYGMAIKFSTFECEYSEPREGEQFPLIHIAGKITAEDFGWLLQRLPKEKEFELSLANLDIVGELKEFPAIKVKSLFMGNMKLHARQLEILAKCILPDELYPGKFELLSPSETDFTWNVKNAIVDQSSWNNGLYSLLKPVYLILREIKSEYIQANEWLRTLRWDSDINQQTLNSINKAFPYLKCLILGPKVLHNFEQTANNKFSVEHLYCSAFFANRQDVLGFIQQFPKVKDLFFFQFDSNFLIDFKKYCPDLKEISIKRMDGKVKIKDLTFLINALPRGCEIELGGFTSFQGDRNELEVFLSQHPQIVMKTIASINIEPRKEKKPFDLEFKPYDPNPSSLDPNWNQGMLINRLIAYQEFFLPAKAMNSYAPSIKKGICAAVAKLFADTVEQKGLEVWNEKWKLIKSWNKHSLPPKDSTLRLALEELKVYVSRYQLQEDTLGNLWDSLQSSQSITNDLNGFLESPPKKPLFISSAWHRTCLIHKENQWIYFDPNYQLGEPQHFSTKEAAVKEIVRVLGLGLVIRSFHESLNPCWNLNSEPINAFLETGGFGLIIDNKEAMEKLNGITLSKAALEGLFYLTTSNIPFWYLGLTQDYSIFTGNVIQKQTLSFFIDYAERTSREELVHEINKGMGYLSNEKRQLLKASLSKCKVLPNCVEVILLSIEGTSLPIAAADPSWLPEKLERPQLTIEPLVDSENRISKKSVQINKNVPLSNEKNAELNEPRPVPLNHPFILNTALTNYQKQPSEPLEFNPFKTWNAAKNEGFETLTAFDYFLFKDQHYSKNLLLHIPDNNQLVNYLHHLQSSQSMKARGLFVINSFDELHCAISTITVDSDGKGVVKPPNSGPLYDFLMEHKLGTPIIAVNWSNFTPQQLVQANTLIDKCRHVDNVQIPKNAIVLGLQNPKDPNAYLGSDFSSRHFKLIDFPNNLVITEVNLPTLEEHSLAEECVLDLFGESNWEAHFYGHWHLTEKGLFFEKSALLQALDNKPEALKLVLKNAPFHSPQFKFAFNSLVSKGYCTVNGTTFELPKNVGIVLEVGFNFKALFDQTVLGMKRGYFSQDDDCVLNPDSLALFFENYQVNSNTRALTTLPGLLEKHAHQTLSICLTAPISLASFARLFETAKTHHTKIKLKIAPGVIIPEEISFYLTENEPSSVSEPCSTRLILSNDIHCTEKMLQNEQSLDMSIDISEETKDRLLYALSGQLKGDKPQFDESVSEVWQALLDKKRVLLKGHFSPALVDALASLFKPNGGIYHNGEWEIPPGELIVLTDTAESFSFVSQVEKIDVSFENKMSLLGLKKQARLLDKYSEEILSAFSYAYLNALAFAKELPDNPADLTKPLRQLPDLPQVDDDYGLEYFKSNAFKEARQLALLEALKYQPTVFLSGETGVGKSSFMHDLGKEPSTSVFFGDIDAWLKASSDNKYNILFMDEANLIKTDWLCFEGLYSDPASVFYKGRYYPLGDNYKVVFAGNPSSYSQERNLPELFQNHPNVVTFGAMNNAYLYHEVLKPILQNNEQAEDIARIFLKTFQAVKKLSKEAISARELQMMAYLFQAQQLPAECTEKAKIVAFTMACQVLPQTLNSEFKTWFEQEFGTLKPELEKVPESIGRKSSKSHLSDTKKMRITPSHHAVYHWLKSFMEVRALKQQGQGKACYGGLSGLIIEGEPGVGKSYFVKEFLLDLGFGEKKINDNGLVTLFDYDAYQKTQKQAISHFYYLPANLSLTVKIDLLNRAFHEGAVIIIDEINTSPLLEELMNALLMGEDLKGRRAITPGFALIGTQNPSSMEGRAQASLASDRRVIHCDFPTYTPEEMVQVVLHKGLEEQNAYRLVYDFLQAQHYARKHNLHPEPCFRDLLKEVKSYKKASKESTRNNATMIQLPFAESVLLGLLKLDNPEHQDLIIELRKIGYETFFYKGEDNALYFLSTMQPDEKQNLLDKHHVVNLVAHLKEKIKCLSFIERTVVGNEALKEVLFNVPIEDLALFLKTASFKQIDFLTLSLNLVDLVRLDKTRFNMVGKEFKNFCRQVDEETSSNIQYKEIIAKRHPESDNYSKNRFFPIHVDKEKEKELLSQVKKPGNL